MTESGAAGCLSERDGRVVSRLHTLQRAATLWRPIPTLATPGATPLLAGLFYLGCIPAAIAEATLPEERWPRAAGLLVLWTALWIVLVAVL